jgi:DNA-binding protein HU-beta
MNKTDLIDYIANDSGLKKTEAAKSLDSFIKAINEKLSQGEQVALAGFGTFSVSERAARTGRNPKTSEPIEIPATVVPKFKAGKALKESVSK